MSFSHSEKQRLLQQVDSLCLYVQKFRDETVYSLEYYKKAFESEKADSDAAARKIAELKSDKENLEAEVQRLKVLISKVAEANGCLLPDPEGKRYCKYEDACKAIDLLKEEQKSESEA